MKNIPYLAESFGEALRTLRQQSKLTQKEVALRIGSVTSYIRFLEYGQNMPTISTFHLLCHALGVDDYEFMALYKQILARKQAADTHQDAPRS